MSKEDNSRIGKKWLIEEDEELIKEIEDKLTFEEIALKHKRTITGIKARVISHIIYPKIMNDNIDINELSIKYNIDKDIIIKYINKAKCEKLLLIDEISRIGKKWLIEEDEELIKEIEDKLTFEEIALKHKRNISSIKARVISHIIYPKYNNEKLDIEYLSIKYNIDKDIIMKYINKQDDIFIRIENKLDKIISYLNKE